MASNWFKRFFGGSGGPANAASSQSSKPNELKRTDTPRNEIQDKPGHTRPKKTKPRAPLPNQTTNTKTPSQNNQNLSILPQTPVAQIKKEKIEENQQLDSEKHKEIQKWVENQQDISRGTPKTSITQNCENFARQINEAGGSNNIAQTEEKQPQEKSPKQPQIRNDLNTSLNNTAQAEETQHQQEKSPEQPEIADELNERFENLRNDNQPNMPKRSVATEETSNLKRHFLNTNEFGSSSFDHSEGRSNMVSNLAEHQQEQDIQKIQEKQCSNLSSSSPYQNNQNLETCHTLKNSKPRSSKHNSERSTKTAKHTEDVELITFSSNQEDLSLVTNQKMVNIDFGSINENNQNTEEKTIPLAKDAERSSSFNDNEENLHTLPKRTKNYHLEQQDQDEISKNTATLANNVSSSITDVEDQFTCQRTLESISQSQEAQDDKPILDKKDVENIPPKSEEILRNSEEHNLEVPPQKTTKRSSITETTSSNQEQTIVSGEDDFLRSTIAKMKSIQQEVAELEKEIDEFLGTSSDDRDYTYMDELMMRNLIKLDNIETQRNQEVRQERKKGIQFIQNMLKALDAKLKENQKKTNEEVPSNTEEREEADTSENVKMDTGEDKVAMLDGTV